MEEEEVGEKEVGEWWVVSREGVVLCTLIHSSTVVTLLMGCDGML